MTKQKKPDFFDYFWAKEQATRGMHKKIKEREKQEASLKKDKT